jgi:fructose-bisphosphate aldolase class II
VRRFLKASVVAAARVCKDRFEAFGAAGWASKIRPVGLDAMAERYLAA